MQYKYIENTCINYTGEQLRSHWIYEKFDILGDAIVAFTGKCDVSCDHMVDLEDVKNNDFIYSEKMLHFIIEHFQLSLEEIVLRQRLFICIIQDSLNEILRENIVVRNGNDLYYKEAKLSVSIATISPVSGLVHVGINIDSKNTPVKAAGLLSEMNVENIKDLAIQLVKRYTNEHQQIKKSIYKVKPVN
ncbi:MAG: DUF366 family protein [Cyanobacteriota bacterium]